MAYDKRITKQNRKAIVANRRGQKQLKQLGVSTKEAEKNLVALRKS